MENAMGRQALVEGGDAAEGHAAPAAGELGNERLRAADGRELTPEEVAARLLEQRRGQDRGWLGAQARRIEHGALLFLASIVPGVSERIIAAREEVVRQRERAEEDRRRAAEEAELAEQADSQPLAAEAAGDETIDSQVNESQTDSTSAHQTSFERQNESVADGETRNRNVPRIGDLVEI
jgi:hypothetical protein